MKKRIQQIIAFTLAIMLVLPILSLGNARIASAKNKHRYHPTISCSQKTLSENGETFTLSLNNLRGNVKNITWYSLNDKVATVQPASDCKTANVTSVKKGTTRIKCTISFYRGPKYNTYCNITVKAAASKLKISKVQKDENGRHIIAVGESYDFNSKLTPRDANDQVYWYIDRTEYATVTSDGTVTGLKAGIVYLTAIAAKSESGVSSSSVRDTICIEVVNLETYDDFYDYWDYCDEWDNWDYWDSWDSDYWDEDSWDWDSWDWDYDDFFNYYENFHKDNHFDYNTKYTFNVKEITLSDSAKLSINFDKAVNSGTVIGYNNALLNSVIVTAKKDSYGATANNPGSLTAYLSDDGKTLTIQSSNGYKGVYNVRLMSSIKSTDGSSLKEYSADVALADNKAPTFTNYTLDNSGLVVTINFSEPMDFSNLQVGEAKVISPSTAVSQTTLNILNNASNYVRSSDKKALIMNLTCLPAAEQNKMFSVRFFNLKDLAGNILNDGSLTIKFGSNCNTKPQAKLATLKRTNYNTLTATFDREIDTPGYAVINNEWIQGVVDTKNRYLVNYSLTAAAVLLTGNQKVSLGYWNGYNVRPDDKTAQVLSDYYTDFTLKAVLLTSVNYSYPTTIILTFDGNVTGTPSFQALQNNVDLFSGAYVNGNTITITLKSTPVLNSTIYILPNQNNKIIDSNGSPVTINDCYVYTAH